MGSTQKIDIELESVAVDSERSQNISAGQKVVLRDAKDGTVHVFSSNDLMLGSFSRAGELQTLDPAKCTARVQTVKRGVGNGQLSVVIRVRHPIDVIKSQGTLVNHRNYRTHAVLNWFHCVCAEYVDPAAKQAGIAAVSGVGGGITAAAAAAAAEEIDLFNKEQLVSFGTFVFMACLFLFSCCLVLPLLQIIWRYP